MRINFRRYISVVTVLVVILCWGINLRYTNKVSIKSKKEIESYQLQIQKLNNELDNERKKIKIQEQIANRGEVNRWRKFKVTFYDLSVSSCGKKKSHPAYGLTLSGYSLKGLNWKNARAIAVDKTAIPIGSIVKIKFTNDDYSRFNGAYVARDTGSKVNKNHIDFYYGENAYKDCIDLGVAEAYIQVFN